MSPGSAAMEPARFRPSRRKRTGSCSAKQKGRPITGRRLSLSQYSLLRKAFDNRAVSRYPYLRIFPSVLEFIFVNNASIVVLFGHARDFSIAHALLNGLAHRLRQGAELRFRARAAPDFHGGLSGRPQRRGVIADDRAVLGKHHLRICARI